MRVGKTVHRWLHASFCLLALAAGATPADAQVTDVVVGITPSCPYGLSACWSGAYASLGALKGVLDVVRSPDSYNCTAEVRLKDGLLLPDPDAWATQFKSFVGDTYGFRGVEVTVGGTVEGSGEKLALRVPGVDQPIALVALHNKLQWNFKKSAARQPEPDERDALAQLAKAKASKKTPFGVQVTGPFTRKAGGYVLEVREFVSTSPD